MKTYKHGNNPIPEGEYYFGDPCYVVPRDKWSELISLIYSDGVADFNDKENMRAVEVDDDKFYMFGTLYGDGEYPLYSTDSETVFLPVDSGTLSIIPMNLIKKWQAEEKAKNMGTFVKLPNTSTLHLSEGVLDIDGGALSIVTEYYDELDYWDEDESDEFDEFEDF